MACVYNHVMPNLFCETKAKERDAIRPLADRMRPTSLDEVVGQTHILHEDSLLRKMITTDTLRSIIFWGPPGTGKTTLANVIAHETKWEFLSCNASAIGVSDIRDIIETAKKRIDHKEGRTILFLDEIHRFHKGQQDVLLEAVEQGVLILIGATTENPSFEIISPLLSRCRVLNLKGLSTDELEIILYHAIKTDIFLKKMDIKINPKAFYFLNFSAKHRIYVDLFFVNSARRDKSIYFFELLMKNHTKPFYFLNFR